MADEVVVGSTRRDVIVVLTDATTGLPINLTGGSAKIQGKSPDLAAVTIDAVMTLTDPQNGKVKYAGIGGLVTQANLNTAGITSATYSLRVRFVDATALVDYSPQFEIIFRSNPLGT
jgi:hypothetical protein